KWDIVKDGLEPEDYRAYLDQELPGLSFAPVSFLSAKTGLNVAETFDLARELVNASRVRIPTGELNRILEAASDARTPSARGQRVRIQYATQAESAPPTFVLFVNDARNVGKDYLRYLENRLRELPELSEVPLRFVVRDKKTPAAPAPRCPRSPDPRCVPSCPASVSSPSSRAPARRPRTTSSRCGARSRWPRRPTTWCGSSRCSRCRAWVIRSR